MISREPRTMGATRSDTAPSSGRAAASRSAAAFAQGGVSRTRRCVASCARHLCDGPRGRERSPGSVDDHLLPCPKSRNASRPPVAYRRASAITGGVMRSVVLPAHNEAILLEQTVTEIVSGLRARGEPFEIVVVENGSTDATPAIVDRLATELAELRVQHLPVADYGTAVRSGLLATEGDVVVHFDVDYYNLEFVDRAQAALDRGAAIVVASKRARGSRDTRPLPRRIVTSTFTLLVRAGFGLQVSDTHGIKALRRALVEPLAQQCRSRADLFDTELLLRAERAGLVIEELPIDVRELRPARTSIWRR